MNISDTKINELCYKYNSNYRALKTSWNDNSRIQNSSYGSNITDARLRGRDDQNYLVIRPQNFNEKIGKVNASEVKLMAKKKFNTLSEITLKEYLENFGEYASASSNIEYSKHHSIYSETRDSEVGIRFQAVIIPADPNKDFETIEFTPETYNYQTIHNNDPRNAILTCTSDGTFVELDKRGFNRQFLHKFDNGIWKKYFMEASTTSHGISLSQDETIDEFIDSLNKDKAVSTSIGISSMGKGFNRLMTIQVPMVQRFTNTTFNVIPACAKASSNIAASAKTSSIVAASAKTAPQSVNAARVSFGKFHNVLEPKLITSFERDNSCSITITVQFYFLCKKIDSDDIKKIIDVLEDAYKGCNWSGNLMSLSKETSFAKKAGFGWNVCLMNISNDTSVAWSEDLMNMSRYKMKLGDIFKVFNISNSELIKIIENLEISDESFHYIHSIAVDYINKGDIEDAFEMFRICNHIYTELYGVPSKFALYNQACCISLACKNLNDKLKIHKFLLDGKIENNKIIYKGSKIPPLYKTTIEEELESKFDAGIKCLSLSVCAGYDNLQHMGEDSDLSFIRENRKQSYENIILTSKLLKM